MNKQLVLPVVLAVLVFGFGLSSTAQAANNFAQGETLVHLTTITPSDLGVDSVGTLPTSPFYFFKEWRRGITRFFTFDSIAKAELELNITNQVAAEVLEVEKAYDACAANALGGGKSCKPEDKVGAVKNALQNYIDAQERLRFRITTINGTSNVADSERFLKEVDEKTAKHAVLLEQIAGRWSTDPYVEDSARKGGMSDPDFDLLASAVKDAQDNILKTFTITVTPVNDAPSLKQKAEEQIKRAGIAIVTVDVVSPTGGEVDLKVTVPKQTQGATFGEKMKAGGYITAVINGGDLLINVTTTAGLAVGNIIRIDNELLIITALTPTSITVSRGANGSTAGAHLSGVRIDLVYYLGTPNFAGIAKAKGNLADAKKAFAEEKYGEAYGLARSAEAIATGINGTRDMDNQAAGKEWSSVTRDLDGQAAGKEFGDKTAPASPETSSKEKVKIIENESPRPTDREEVAPKATTTPEKEKPETAQPSGSSAGPSSNYDRDN